jgi:hypothetical protein
MKYSILFEDKEDDVGHIDVCHDDEGASKN